MSSPDLEIEGSEEPSQVWRVGFAPDAWAWTPWTYADDEGLFGGRWDDQQYGSAHQSGRYCFVTHSRSIAALTTHYPFNEHGLAAGDVDAALLKDARDRILTRSIARWLYDLHDEGNVVDGVRFNSRHGDEIRVWAVFERAGDPARSPRIQPSDEPAKVHPDHPELQEAFARFDLHWHED